MRKDSLTFHLRPANLPLNAFDESDAYSQAFIHSLGLKVESGCWSTVLLSSPIFFDFVREAKARILNGEATFYGYNTVSQRLLEDDDTPGEWYQYVASPSNEEIREPNGMKTCKAYAVPATAHIASGGGYDQYVDEKVKALVEEHQLTGIAFEWVKDTGKYRSRQWYIPVPENPIGRGVDHPWFDPATLKGSASGQPEHPNWRTGVWDFYINQLKQNLIIDDPAYQELLQLYSLPQVRESGETLKIITPRRYLRSFLPTTDFAYNWKDVVVYNIRYCIDSRGLCFNRRVRDLLLTHRLINEDDLEMLQILDTVPVGTIVLDGDDDLPEPYLTRQERQQHAPILAAAWKRFLATEKPVRRISLRDALKLLRKEKSARKEDFSKGAGKAVLDKVLPPLPSGWLAVLALANGGAVNDECTLLPVEVIRTNTQELAAAVAATYDDYPYDHPVIVIGTAADGDWFALEDRGESTEDAMVFRITHEGFGIIYRWDSIALFISDMLSGFYDD